MIIKESLMKKKNATELLQDMIGLLTFYLTELSDVLNLEETQFLYGEKTAYTECLEMLSCWDQAEKYGLNRDVEMRFPLI